MGIVVTFVVRIALLVAIWQAWGWVPAALALLGLIVIPGKKTAWGEPDSKSFMTWVRIALEVGVFVVGRSKYCVGFSLGCRPPDRLCYRVRHSLERSKKLDAITKVRQLLSEGKTGKEIAEILLQEDFTIQQARDAFLREGYVAAIVPFTSDVSELHVSDHPMVAGLAATIALSEPRALPSVVWQRR